MFTNFAYWHVKILFDLSGYAAAFLATRFFYKKVFRSGELPDPFVTRRKKWGYYISITVVALFFAVSVSTFDGAMIPGRDPSGGIILSKSIAGALFGGVLAAELYKRFCKIRVPTGILFLPGLVIGLFVGRFGALATGLHDFTYGLPTRLPWGVDF